MISLRAIICICAANSSFFFFLIIGAYGVVLKCRHKASAWFLKGKYLYMFNCFETNVVFCARGHIIKTGYDDDDA